jgi:hypothetical protein
MSTRIAWTSLASSTTPNGGSFLARETDGQISRQKEFLFGVSEAGGTVHPLGLPHHQPLSSDQTPEYLVHAVSVFNCILVYRDIDCRNL